MLVRRATAGILDETVFCLGRLSVGGSVPLNGRSTPLHCDGQTAPIPFPFYFFKNFIFLLEREHARVCV